MFKFVAFCTIEREGDSQENNFLSNIPRQVNKRDNKPLFTDVLFSGHENGYDTFLPQLKPNVKTLHEHGIRAHFILDSGYKFDCSNWLTRWKYRE